MEVGKRRMKGKIGSMSGRVPRQPRERNKCGRLDRTDRGGLFQGLLQGRETGSKVVVPRVEEQGGRESMGSQD